MCGVIRQLRQHGAIDDHTPLEQEEDPTDRGGGLELNTEWSDEEAEDQVGVEMVPVGRSHAVYHAHRQLK